MIVNVWDPLDREYSFGKDPLQTTDQKGHLILYILSKILNRIKIKKDRGILSSKVKIEKLRIQKNLKG